MIKVDLSVIIVTHNSANFLVACVHAVRAATVGLKTQLLVVDSGSTDGTAAIVRGQYPEATLLLHDNIGFSAANNMALPLCIGNKIVLLNPDTIVSPQSLTLLIQALDADSTIGAVGPSLLFPNGVIQDHSAHNLPRLGNMVTWLFLLDKLEWSVRFHSRRIDHRIPPKSTFLDGFVLLKWTRDQQTYVSYLSGACLMMRASVVEQTGFLDTESPLYLDDIDYCRRLQNAGWKLLYLPQASVTHFWQQSSSSLKRDADFYALLCHSIWIYLRKHHSRRVAAAYSFAAFSASLVRWFLSTISLCVHRGQKQADCVRHQKLSKALFTWSISLPKRPPALPFTPAPQPPVWTIANRWDRK